MGFQSGLGSGMRAPTERRGEYTRHAFVLARQANPAAILLINDYRLDDEYVALCDALRDQDARPLYDAIGLQSHQHGGAMPPEHIWAACERFAPFGVPLHWTENTIVSGPRVDGQWSGTTPEGEALQADQVALFYTIAFSHPATEAITWWDLSDRYAWMGAPAGLLREDLSPKPAYDRLMSLIHGDWWTQEDLVTTEDGAAPFRGFHGDYLITVEAEGAQATIETSLGPEAPGRILVQISR
jgi:GH35 family endo-1,4-beta-xylanase